MPRGEKAACVIMISLPPCSPPPVFNRREYFMPKTLFSGNGRRSLSHIAAGPDIVENILQEVPTGCERAVCNEGGLDPQPVSASNALCRFESCVGDQIDRGGGRANERRGKNDGKHP